MLWEHLTRAHPLTRRVSEAAAKGCPVSGDREEPGRVFGMPRRGTGQHARHDEESRRVLGVPVDWYGQVEWDELRALRHPIKAYKRWALRRRLGPYAPDDDDIPPTS